MNLHEKVPVKAIHSLRDLPVLRGSKSVFGLNPLRRMFLLGIALWFLAVLFALPVILDLQELKAIPTGRTEILEVQPGSPSLSISSFRSPNDRCAVIWISGVTPMNGPLPSR